MKIYKHLTIAALILSMSNAMAKTSDFDETFYDDEEEGRLVTKVRLMGGQFHSKQKKFPASANNNPIKKNEELFGHMVGAEASTALFFTDNLATELSLGIGAMKNRKLTNIVSNYSDSASKKPGITSKTWVVPIALTMQYHIAPFGAISPYVGVGGHYTFIHTKAAEYKLKNTYGLAAQIGLDFVMKDDKIINIDVKKLFATMKPSYKSSFMGTGKGFKTTMKADPLIIGVGFGLKL